MNLFLDGKHSFLKDVCKSINIKNTTLLMMLNGSNKNRTNIIRYEKD